MQWYLDAERPPQALLTLPECGAVMWLVRCLCASSFLHGWLSVLCISVACSVPRCWVCSPARTPRPTSL